MKIKIVENNWDGYNGPLAGYNFIDGVSEDDIPAHKALYIGGTIKIVDAETGLPVSESQEALVLRNVPVKASEELKLAPIEEKVEVAAEEKVEVAVVKYTRAELEAIADEKGIKGIREIAAPYGIKSTSIVELMEAILKAQDK